MKKYNIDILQGQISLFKESLVINLEPNETPQEKVEYIRQEIEGQISLNI